MKSKVTPKLTILEMILLMPFKAWLEQSQFKICLGDAISKEDFQMPGRNSYQERLLPKSSYLRKPSLFKTPSLQRNNALYKGKLIT